MPQRSLWRGAISFGLMDVPVQMYCASRDRGLKLHFLDRRDFSPVGYERINKSTGKSVDWEHVVKGYEYAKGEYVALTDADFKQANVKASETIEIASFTQARDISPIFYETPYYLLPNKGGEKIYALLNQTLQATQKVAFATFVLRGREHLCVVTATDRLMMLVTLRFADEILPPAQLSAAGTDVKLAKPKGAEIAMAQKVVEGMTSAWKPQLFRDSYRADLMKRIRSKISKQQTHSLADDSQATKRPKAEVIDLMQALKKSVRLRAKHAERGTLKNLKQRKRA
jgi:DNA end-binding protein Ku